MFDIPIIIMSQLGRVVILINQNSSIVYPARSLWLVDSVNLFVRSGAPIFSFRSFIFYSFLVLIPL